MTGGARITAAAGYLVFGAPALFAVLASAATVARFGPGPALAPAALWFGYCRHRPSTGQSAAVWAGLGAGVVAMLAGTPIWFWAAPSAAVVLLELAPRRPRRPHPGGRRRGRKP